MKALKEKYNPTPTTTEALDMYWDDGYSYDNYYDDYYDSYGGIHDEYPYGQQVYYYAYIKPLDKFITSHEKLKNFSDYGSKDYDVYEDEFGDMHTPVYSLYAPTKIEAFLGCIILTINGENGKVSEKIKKIYDKLSYEYPEVIIKLLGKV